MPGRTFSFKEVVFTAIVTLVISGGGGALFNEYLSRAKPAASIISVGFQGVDGLVELPDSLVDFAYKSH